MGVVVVVLLLFGEDGHDDACQLWNICVIADGMDEENGRGHSKLDGME